MKQDFHQLNSNIEDMIVEQQLKMGYSRAPLQLFYPLQSLNRLLNASASEEEMRELLCAFANDTADHFGSIGIDRTGEMFRLSFSPAAQDYAHGLIEKYGFLKELTSMVASHHATMEEVIALFNRWSGNPVIEWKQDEDFDVLIYFADGVPDRYRYCLTEEGGHVSYHRFTEADYRDFYPEEQNSSSETSGIVKERNRNHDDQ